MYAIDSSRAAASISVLFEPRLLEVFAWQGRLCLFQSLAWDNKSHGGGGESQDRCCGELHVLRSSGGWLAEACP
jgi:hypothetical protein